MKDLFRREHDLLDESAKYLEEFHNDHSICEEKYQELNREYELLLRQLQRLTRISDRTTNNLQSSRLELMDRVEHDSLTGIYNRFFLDEQLNYIIREFKQSCGNMLAVFMMDIDYFKLYNDTYGHTQGDECLKVIARTLKNSVDRSQDFVARYGGEEFVAVLPQTGKSGAMFMASRMLNNIANCKIPHEKSKAADYVTISIGITSGIVFPENNSIDFLEQADKALYLSKKNGKNRYTYLGMLQKQGDN